MIEQRTYCVTTEHEAHYGEACVELISSGATCWPVACLSLLFLDCFFLERV